MAATYIAYVPRKRLPTIAELNRAMSSRGTRVKVPDDGALDALSGAVAVKIEGEPVSVEVQVEELAGDALAQQQAQLAEQGGDDAEKRLTVLKTTDIKFTFQGEGASETWARDLARGLALLACGAFENPADGRLLHYGY